MNTITVYDIISSLEKNDSNIRSRLYPLLSLPKPYLSGRGYSQACTSNAPAKGVREAHAFG